MKTLMKLFSILFLIAIGYSIYQLLMVSKEIYGVLGAVFLGNSDVTNSLGGEVITNASNDVRIFAFIFSNLISFIILAISSSMLLKDDTNKLLRIIPFLVIIGIAISMILNFFSIDITSGIGNIAAHILNFLKSAEVFFLPIVCLGNLSANNSISEIIKKIGYIVLALSLGLLIYLWIKKNAFDVLPDPYAENTLATLGDFGTSVKFFTTSIFIEFACLILCYTTNYAFEITTINVDNVNYEELKKQAEFSAQARFDSIYNKEKIEEIDRSVSEKTGLMNINNQLGKNSNVGQVSDEVKNKVGLVETSFVMSKGPVVNQSIINNEQNNTNNTNDKFIQNPDSSQNNNQSTPVINPSLVEFNNNPNNKEQ